MFSYLYITIVHIQEQNKEPEARKKKKKIYLEKAEARTLQQSPTVEIITMKNHLITHTSLEGPEGRRRAAAGINDYIAPQVTVRETSQ